MTDLQPVADGHHRGLKWCVERYADKTLFVTVNGFVGPHYVHQSIEWREATPRKVMNFVEQVEASAKAKKGKR